MKRCFHLLSLSAVLMGMTGLNSALPQTAPTDQKKPTATSKADLQKQAKITKEEATKIALAGVPNGVIKECELEREKGRLIWSFDIATPDTKAISEVQVDARTGAVVSVTRESAADQAREKRAEAKKAPKRK